MKRARSGSEGGADDEPHTLARLISGGQTGADRAALEAAEALGIPTGGWAAPGFLTSRGPDPALGTRFHLTPVVLKGTPTNAVAAGYVQRSIKNVDTGDGTLVFRLHPSVGTDRTIQYCTTGRWGRARAQRKGDRVHRPCLVIRNLSSDVRDANVSAIRTFLQQHQIAVLNVAGHRAPPPGCPGFCAAVRTLLSEALAA